MGVQHAYIGGFALACIGSNRPVKMSNWSCAVRHVSSRELTSPRFYGIDVFIMGTPVFGLRDSVVDLDLHLGDDLQLTFFYTAEVR